MATDAESVVAATRPPKSVNAIDSAPAIVDSSSGSTAAAHAPEDGAADATLRHGLAVGRAYYFVGFVAFAAISAYLNVHLESLGITPTELGLIALLTAIVGFVATPIWSAAADARQWHRALLVVATVSTGVISLAYLRVDAFAGAMIAGVLVAISSAPIPVVLDSSMVALARKAKASYPRQRVWGTIGLVAGALGASWIVARYGFAPIVWLQFVAFALIATVLTLRLPIDRTAERVEYLRGLRVLLGLRQYRGVVVFMIGLGIIRSTNLDYGGLYILALGGSAALIGVMFALVALVEIPAMLSADFVSRRLGLRGTLLTAGVGITILYGIAGVVTSAWLYIGVMLMVGLCSGIVWAAASPLAMHFAPLQLRATAVGIMLAAYFGAGFGTGGLVGGIVLDAVGGGSHYITAGALMLLCVVYFFHATRKA